MAAEFIYKHLEVSLAAEDMKTLTARNAEKKAREIVELCNDLISNEKYGKFLNDDLKLSAKKLCWGLDRTLEEYKEYFLTNVLMGAYRPFDESHRNYYNILNAIQKLNPEWEKIYVGRHENWVKMLQGRKVPIYIGTQ